MENFFEVIDINKLEDKEIEKLLCNLKDNILKIKYRRKHFIIKTYKNKFLVQSLEYSLVNSNKFKKLLSCYEVSRVLEKIRKD